MAVVVTAVMVAVTAAAVYRRYTEMAKLKSKTDANYRTSTTDRKCGNCEYFYSDSKTCSKVSGVIEASGISDIFSPAKKSKE